MKTTKNFTTVRKKTKGVHVIHQDLLKEHPVDPIAEHILEELEGKISYPLIGFFKDNLRGFDMTMQIEMADDIQDFTNKHIAHTTGVIAADIILDLCYQMIALEHGILKKGEKSRIMNMVKHVNQ